MKAGSVSDDKTVNEFAARMVEHLKANKVEATGTLARFGPVLAIDSATETITNLDGEAKKQANAMLFREYRKGFEVKDLA